jgi:signal transduction histidine kinase
MRRPAGCRPVPAGICGGGAGGSAAAFDAGGRDPRARRRRGVGEGPSLQGLVDQGWPEVVCLPLVVRGTPVGSLLVLCPEGEKPGDVGGSALRAVADQAAMAVEVARVRPKTSEAAVIRERHGLARELHDSVTQLLFATSLLARASHLKLARIGGAGEKELREMLADLENSSTSALAQMRALLVELPPRHAPTAPDKEASHD